LKVATLVKKSSLRIAYFLDNFTSGLKTQIIKSFTKTFRQLERNILQGIHVFLKGDFTFTRAYDYSCIITIQSPWL